MAKEGQSTAEAAHLARPVVAIKDNFKAQASCLQNDIVMLRQIGNVAKAVARKAYDDGTRGSISQEVADYLRRPMPTKLLAPGDQTPSSKHAGVDLAPLEDLFDAVYSVAMSSTPAQPESPAINKASGEITSEEPPIHPDRLAQQQEIKSMDGTAFKDDDNAAIGSQLNPDDVVVGTKYASGGNQEPLIARRRPSSPKRVPNGEDISSTIATSAHPYFFDLNDAFAARRMAGMKLWEVNWVLSEALNKTLTSQSSLQVQGWMCAVGHITTGGIRIHVGVREDLELLRICQPWTENLRKLLKVRTKSHRVIMQNVPVIGIGDLTDTSIKRGVILRLFELNRDRLQTFIRQSDVLDMLKVNKADCWNLSIAVDFDFPDVAQEAMQKGLYWDSAVRSCCSPTSAPATKVTKPPTGPKPPSGPKQQLPPSKPQIIQRCGRCQAFGHCRNGCTRPYRCFRCGGQHRSKACKLSVTNVNGLSSHPTRPSESSGIITQQIKEEIDDLVHNQVEDAAPRAARSPSIRGPLTPPTDLDRLSQPVEPRADLAAPQGMHYFTGGSGCVRAQPQRHSSAEHHPCNPSIIFRNQHRMLFEPATSLLQPCVSTQPMRPFSSAGRIFGQPSFSASMDHTTGSQQTNPFGPQAVMAQNDHVQRPSSAAPFLKAALIFTKGKEHSQPFTSALSSRHYSMEELKGMSQHSTSDRRQSVAATTSSNRLSFADSYPSLSEQDMNKALAVQTERAPFKFAFSAPACAALQPTTAYSPRPTAFSSANGFGAHTPSKPSKPENQAPNLKRKHDENASSNPKTAYVIPQKRAKVQENPLLLGTAPLWDRTNTTWRSNGGDRIVDLSDGKVE